MKKIIFQENLLPGIEHGIITETRRMHDFKKIHGQKELRVVGFNLSDTKYLIVNLIDDRYPCKPIQVKSRYHLDEILYIAEPFCEIKEEIKYKYACQSKVFRENVKWKSPLFLKEKDARFKIKISEINYCKVAMLSEKDCINSGIIKLDEEIYRVPGTDKFYEHAIVSYSYLWDSINPDYPVKSDPLSFKYTFKLL